MKVVEINSCNYGSTGKIMLQIAQVGEKYGYEVTTSCPASRSNASKWVSGQYFIGDRFSRNLHLVFGKVTGLQGLFSIHATCRFLRKLDEIEPDVVHLHNLHNCYINLPMLFHFIKKKNIPAVWTFHDCWPFTGHCVHFTMAKCEKWKTGCFDCPSYQEYPASLFDNSRFMWKLKKKWFTGVENMTIVTPSQWLADLVKQSFLKEYPVKVIHNGIDLSVFHPVSSDFRRKYNILKDKKILLGVAFGWEIRKGLDVFIELSKRLDPDKYQIVLVGTDETVDKQLPPNIISIHRTQDQKELAEIYTAADLLVNPTREENYPTVNMEAIACGTPVATFQTGGSPEILSEKTGCIIPSDNIEVAENVIKRVVDEHLFSTENCIAQRQQFDAKLRFDEYMELYREINEKFKINF